MNSLTSLTANYTDSEGEEHLDGSPMTTEQLSPPTQFSDSSNTTPTKPRSKTLVSYHDDTIVSDDERSERAISESPVEEKKEPSIPDEYDADLPPEPQGRCSFELQENIRRLYENMNNKGLDMNVEIQLRKEFRNPSIYEKLIQYCGINEFGTNYSPEVYDPLRWNRSSYYDELAKVQKAEMEAKEKERKEKTKVEFIMGTAKKTQNTAIPVPPIEEDKKRKSKWDQVATNVTSIPKVALPLTTTVSGTKGTVISAFGSLNKKPRI